MRDWYQDFLAYRSSDYADFEQYYFVPQDDDYDDHEESQAQAVSMRLFGVGWNAVTERHVAQAILNLQQRARAYKANPKAWRNGAQGQQERGEIETDHR